MDLNNTTAYEIANNIRNKKIKAIDVLTHYISLARAATEKTNCITIFVDEAIEETRQLDEKINSGVFFSEDEFPLLGVPVSLKDSFDIKGYPTAAGYRENLKYPASKDSSCVKVLRQCGAIPFCKTNNCQFSRTLESSNPVYGKTTNPVDSRFTSGGSTSGEAPLIKLGGSILGVGSDIGGSLRVPAHFCGVYTFKPTPHRIPLPGHFVSTPGQEAVKVSVGPVTNNVSDLKLFMKAFLSKQCWKHDDSGIPLPYQEFKLKNKLRIGYIISDGVFPASPVCQRAVLEVVKCLKNAGHEVFPFEFSQLAQTKTIGQPLLTADQLSVSLNRLTGEGVDETISRYVKATSLPNFVKTAISFILRLWGQPILAETVGLSRKKNILEMWEVQDKRSKLRQAFQSQWEEHNLDILVMPPFATPAFPHGAFIDTIAGISYSFLANLLELPAGVIPVTYVQPKDRIEEGWLRKQLPSSISPEELHRRLYAHAYPESSKPLPVGVQVVGMRFEDEKVLDIMEIIDISLKKIKT